MTTIAHGRTGYVRQITPMKILTMFMRMVVDQHLAIEEAVAVAISRYRNKVASQWNRARGITTTWI
jgi:hypothetical protein